MTYDEIGSKWVGRKESYFAYEINFNEKRANAVV
jgi:hypothetical protein|tara:strand:- start:8729 stop:8830 length:102 start_codon:yes stop_codon:yes gene_type:complete